MFETKTWAKYLTRLEGKVAVVSLNNLEQKNNVSIQVMEELVEILDELEQDDRVRCVLVTHEGKDFSAGGCAEDEAAYLAEKGCSYEEAVDVFSKLGGKVIERIERFPKPTVVSGRGVCWGGATAVYAAFDIRLAGESFQMYDEDLYYGCGSSWGMCCLRLPLWIGRNKLMDYLLLDEYMPARELYHLGLVSRVFPDEMLEISAMKIAQTLATSAPLAVKAFKERVRDVLYGENYDRWRQAELEAADRVNASEDAAKGAEYFNQGLRYEFQGK